MERAFVFIKKLEQLSNYVFQIVWNDEKVSLFRLSDLQKRCPCARCQEMDAKEGDKEVRASKISSIGNYALRIDFTSGCSRGVFTFQLLRQIGLS